MITVVQITIVHDKPIPDLGDLIAGRAWTIEGVKSAEQVTMSPTGRMATTEPNFQDLPIHTKEGTAVVDSFHEIFTSKLW